LVLRAAILGGVRFVNAEQWSEQFGEYLRLLNRSEKTVHGYCLETRLFLKFLVERGVSEVSGIRREDVSAYRVCLHEARKTNGEPLTMKTQASKLGAVFSFLRYLYSKQFILVNPARDMKLPKVPDSLPAELPDEEQVLKLLEQPDTNSPSGRRDRAILELLYSSALRNSEMRALRIEDLDLHRLEVRVCCGKGQKGRVVPLGEPAAVWLEDYLKRGRPHLVRDGSNDVLFLNRWGRPFTSEVLSQTVSRHAVGAELPMKVTPHVLRHACATHMLARKAGLRHLQRLLGHANTTTTQRYTRVEISDLREVFLRCHPRES
jgi:integrase/recombinase XerD